MRALTRRAEFPLVISATSFGTLAVFGKLAYADGVNVQTLLGFRFLLAGSVLLLVVVARRRPRPGRRTFLALVALGSAGYVGQSAAYFNSLRFVPAAVTSILLYTYPAIVTVASVRLYGAPMDRARAAAVVLALLGSALVASPSGGLRWEGIVLGLLSAAVYSTYILAGKRVMARVDPVTAITVIALSGGLTYMAFTLATHSLSPPHSARGWLAIVGLALIATVVGGGGFLAGLRRTDPGRASLISTLEPVSTATLAFLIFGELLGPLQLVGGALVLAAVVMTARAPEKALPAEPMALRD
ncbi:MAG: DMT family transporter [Candidatus Dormibacteria bacterium]